MDWNRVEGNWKQMKGAVKQQWGKLTDDDLTQINGSQEKLEGIIQERYGIAKDETRKQIDSWYQNQGLAIGAAADADGPGPRLFGAWLGPKPRAAIEEQQRRIASPSGRQSRTISPPS